MFSRGSRYEVVATATWVDATGREIVYKLLRPIPEEPVQQVHLTAAAERSDQVGFRYFGDPEQFWRICDANTVLQSESMLVPPGRRLLIPRPGR